MSDVEKAISGLAEDEELLQKHHQQQQQQQQPSITPLNKINVNNYNLQNDAGNSSLLQKLSGSKQPQHHSHSHLHATLQQDSSTTNATYLTAKQHNCLSRVAKLIFSTPGLVVMVIVYSIMGAFIFPLLEAPQDISKSALIAKSREECLKELWIITEKLNVLYERNWTMLVHEQLRRFEGTIVAATRNMAAGATTTPSSSGVAGMGGGSGAGGGGGGVGGEEDAYGMAIETTTAKTTTTIALGRYGGGNNIMMEYSDLTTTRWSFSEALLYSVTVITTIGHGSLTPRTAGGKIATIFYALIGVPLMLMCLSSLGALLAEGLQCTYARLCCRWPQYMMDTGGNVDRNTVHSKRSQRQSQLHASRAEATVAKETANQIKSHFEHQCELQEHKNAMNCKNCKYDAIIGETNTSHCYDYKLCNDATTMAAVASSSSPSPLLSLSATAASATTAITTTTATATAATAMTTIKLGHKEDCCQLLQTTPGNFTQHLSTCMQLKMSPTITMSSGSAIDITTAQQQTQQQQHQYYQQRPDVMPIASGHKLSSQQPTTATTAAACRMVLPQSLPPPQPQSQSQRFYANVAAPAMAAYHIVSSASANSSPTHYSQATLRHYIVPQIPPPTALLPLPSSGTSVTGAQHFMAVPSSMLRFHHQTAEQMGMQQQQQQQGSLNATSNININPLALPVSATATVYFPIVTSTAASSQNSNQHLIKYHTIQMPHKKQQQGLPLLQQNDLHENQVINADENLEATLFPPPPPPAYQTATVHGIRRAKFITKPQPQEINTLLYESDISCRHDLSQNFSTLNGNSNNKNKNVAGGELQILTAITTTTVAAVLTTTTITTATTTIATTNSYPTTTAATTTTTHGITPETTLLPTPAPAPAINSFYGSSSNTSTTTDSLTPASTLATTLAQSNTNAQRNYTTNIYQNHRESATCHSVQQQQAHDVVHNQMGLIFRSPDLTSKASATTIAANVMGDEEVEQEEEEEEEQEEQQCLGDCPHGTPSRIPLLSQSSNSADDKSHTRSFLNATAASFHRHTLNTFQRSSHSMANQPKSIIINHKGECNLHIPKESGYSSGSICYGDQYEDTSDDDCAGLEGTNIYKLRHLHHARNPMHEQMAKQLAPADCCDNQCQSLVSLSESASQIPQVPIVVVLIILTFYVCLGTVVFALWENWSLIDGAYFCFVTLTTIGYGDFVPWQTFHGPDIQLFACCAYLLLGLVLVAMSFSILETQLIWKCKRLAVRLKLAKE